MKNSKRNKMARGREKHQHRVYSEGEAVKVSDSMWRRAATDGAYAKEMLIGLEFPNGARVKFVELENGSQIPVRDVTEKQAQDFMAMLAPERCWQGEKQ